MTATTFSNLSVVADSRPERRYRLAGVVMASLLLPLASHGFSAQAADAWYNTDLGCESGSSLGSVKLLPNEMPVPDCGGLTLGSRITNVSSWSDIESAVVVIDLRQVKAVTFEQMADYVALVGLADVRLDANPIPVPSILQLFGTDSPPQGLTRWDRALLYSLYNTSQWNKLQLPPLELTMARRIARRD